MTLVLGASGGVWTAYVQAMNDLSCKRTVPKGFGPETHIPRSSGLNSLLFHGLKPIGGGLRV